MITEENVKKAVDEFRACNNGDESTIYVLNSLETEILEKSSNSLWVLMCEYVDDGEDYFSTRIFKTKEGALKALEDGKKEFYDNDHLADSDELVVEEGKLYFTAYEDGDYGNDHINLRVEEIPVEN